MTEEKKDKFEVIMSDEAKAYIDHLLETGNKEEFMDVTNMLKEISENPEKGYPVTMGYNEDILRELSEYIGQRVTSVSDTAGAATLLFGDPDFRIINIDLVNGKDVGLFDAEMENQVIGEGGVDADDTFLEEVSHDGKRYVLKFGIDGRDEKIIVKCEGIGIIDLEKDDGSTDVDSSEPDLDLRDSSGEHGAQE